MQTKIISNCKVFLILGAWLIISGCSTPPANEPSENNGGDLATTPTALVQTVAEPASANEPVLEMTTDRSLSWSSFAGAVSHLRAYRREMILQFEPGQSNGSSKSWRVESAYTFNSSPESQFHEIGFYGEGAVEDFQSITIGQQIGSYYLRIPDGSCLSISAEEFSRMNSGIVDPDSYLAGINMPKLINTGEIVSGQKTSHYSLDQNSLSGYTEQELTVDGHLFVSEESGLPLLVTMEINGEADFLQNGRREQGTLHLEMTLVELSGEYEVGTGLDCLKSAPYPIPGDAYEVTVLNELIAYMTRFSVQELISYYSTELSVLGWELKEEPTVLDQIAVLTFLRNQDELVIELERDPELGVISVLIAP